MERVRKHFQPEFLNRIDEFICFEPLRCGCCFRSAARRFKHCNSHSSVIAHKLPRVYADGLLESCVFCSGCVEECRNCCTCTQTDLLSPCGALCTICTCSNDQISTIVGLRVKGVAKRVAEKKMRLELRDSAVE